MTFRCAWIGLSLFLNLYTKRNWKCLSNFTYFHLKRIIAHIIYQTYCEHRSNNRVFIMRYIVSTLTIVSRMTRRSQENTLNMFASSQHPFYSFYRYRCSRHCRDRSPFQDNAASWCIGLTKKLPPKTPILRISIVTGTQSYFQTCDYFPSRTESGYSRHFWSNIISLVLGGL